MVDVLAAFGLSAATGLNAYLPLLIVGLLARYTDIVTLKAPWNTLENPWVLAVLAVLLAVEMTVDKIPAVDSANDVIQTLVRPAAGAILFAAGSNAISDINPALAMICGILAAGSIHTFKATARPAVTAATVGVGNPVVSLLEDILSALATLVSIFLPVLAALLVAMLLLMIVWRYLRRRHRTLAT